MARTVEPNAVSLLTFGTALTALLKYKVDVVWAIPVAGVVGLFLNRDGFLWYHKNRVSDHLLPVTVD